MGLILSRDAETRSIKKAHRSIDDAEQLILKNELERAKGEIRKANESLACCSISEVNADEVSDAYVRLAEDMLHCNMNDDALRAAERAVQISPDDLEANMTKARILTMVGHAPEAMSMLDNLLLTNPDKKQLWMLRAVVAERENDELTALDSYKKAVSVDPLDLKLYDLIISKDPDKSSWMRRKAELLLRLGKPNEAIKELDRFLATDPSDTHALLLRAEASLQVNDVAKAQQAYDMVLATDPRNKIALTARARYVAHQGNVSEALRYYKDLLRADPSDVIAWNEVANLLLVANRYEESSMAFERALSIDPNNRDAMDGKVKVMDAMGHGSEADSLHQRLAEIKQMAQAAPPTPVLEAVEINEVEEDQPGVGGPP